MAGALAASPAALGDGEGSRSCHRTRDGDRDVRCSPKVASMPRRWCCGRPRERPTRARGDPGLPSSALRNDTDEDDVVVPRELERGRRGTVDAITGSGDGARRYAMNCRRAPIATGRPPPVAMCAGSEDVGGGGCIGGRSGDGEAACFGLLPLTLTVTCRSGEGEAEARPCEGGARCPLGFSTGSADVSTGRRRSCCISDEQCTRTEYEMPPTVHEGKKKAQSGSRAHKARDPSLPSLISSKEHTCFGNIK